MSPIATATATTAYQNMRLIPFYVPESTTFTRIAVRVSTGVGGSVYRMGIYSSDSNDEPSSLVLDAGTVSTPGAGSYAITISQTLSAGLYWLAGVHQTNQGTGLVIRIAATTQGSFLPSGTVSGGINANPLTCFQVASVTGSLPSTISSPTLQPQGPLIYLGV
jgi:hypothetical protein